MRTHKSIIALVFMAIFTNAQTSQSQNIIGTWNGALKIQQMQLRLTFHIEANGNGYSATMDSPDQGVFGIPATSATFDGATLSVAIANIGVSFTGELKDSLVVGTFRQAGMELPLTLSRGIVEKVVVKRPQDPTKPYPYRSEDVTFTNKSANITLAGTLTVPQGSGRFPAVVFISGSGAQDRNEEVFNHRPFLVIADHLARNGIASLRFDDRGTAQSTGTHKGATSADFATDVESAIAYLKSRKEINLAQIGLIGHSEGGVIAPMVASKSNDVKFVVLLAGTGIKGDKLLLLQMERIGHASGMPQSDIDKATYENGKVFDMVMQSTNDEQLKAEITGYISNMVETDTTITIPQGMSKQEFIAMQVERTTDPWMLYFIRLDPTVALKSTKCAVLAINGEMDLQVPYDVNMAAIEKALKEGGNKNVTIKSFPELNHLFQRCKTGLPAEYAQIEQTIEVEVLDYITQWIKTQTKSNR